MPVSSPSSSPIPRAPTFLALVKGTVGQATFGAPAGTIAGAARIVPFFERLSEEPAPPSATVENEPMEAPPEIESLAPPLPPPQPHPGPEFAERLARAIAELRATSAGLAEQTGADTMEMAVIIARRIIETEIGAGTAPLFSLIRSAIRRLGESRQITIRLCPSDAAAVEEAGQSSPLHGLAIARVEIRPDRSLSPGDVVVDGEHGAVDGRLATRLDEVRRILTRTLVEDAEVTP